MTYFLDASSWGEGWQLKEATREKHESQHKPYGGGRSEKISETGILKRRNMERERDSMPKIKSGSDLGRDPGSAN